jgi:hypothetical protein
MLADAMGDPFCVACSSLYAHRSAGYACGCAAMVNMVLLPISSAGKPQSRLWLMLCVSVTAL